MKILDYVKKLFPGIKRSQVLDDIKAAKQIISEILIPGWELAEAQFGANFKNADNRRYATQIGNALRGKVKGSFCKASVTVLQNLLETLTYLEGLVVEEFGDEIVRDSLTYRKATILRWVDLVMFLTDYSRVLLRHVVGMEDHDTHGQDHGLVPGDFNYLNKNLAAFAGVMVVAAEGKAVFTKAVEEIPEILVDDESTDAAKATIGIAKLDRLQLGFLTPNTSPIYWLRMQAANRDVSRYHAALEERKALELRLLRMKEGQKPGENPALDKQIDYLSGRIQRLNGQIREWEERHG